MDLQILAILFLLGIHQCFSENQCLGTRCYCTEYPVHISCDDGYPAYIPDMIKRMALSITIKGVNFESVRLFNFKQYVSLKKVEIQIPENKLLCDWLNVKKKIFPTVVFNKIEYCNQMILKNENIDNQENIDHDELVTDTGYIKITSGQLTGWIFLTLVVVIGFSIRKKLQ